MRSSDPAIWRHGAIARARARAPSPCAARDVTSRRHVTSTHPTRTAAAATAAAAAAALLAGLADCWLCLFFLAKRRGGEAWRGIGHVNFSCSSFPCFLLLFLLGSRRRAERLHNKAKCAVRKSRWQIRRGIIFIAHHEMITANIPALKKKRREGTRESPVFPEQTRQFFCVVAIGS